MGIFRRGRSGSRGAAQDSATQDSAAQSAATGPESGALCPELAEIGVDSRLDPPPTNGDQSVCEDCAAIGEHHWAHLRMCLTCGHVACCDSSPRRHATAHFHDSQHPVMRSAEPGEQWRWCYVHEVTG